MSDRIRFAVVGCGTVSGYGHLPAIAGLTDLADLAAVVDVDETNLAKVKAAYPQAAAYSDYRPMLAREKIDAVTIATRTDTHVEIASAAFAAGKHVLLEKPPAQTVEQGRLLIERQRQSGVVCGTGLILRYAAGHKRIRQWLDAGEIGRLRAIRLISDWWGADHRGAHPGRGMRLYAHDGSIIVGEGIHHADLARWYAGSEYGRIFCVEACVHHGPYSDHAAMTAVMQNGVVVNIENSHAYGHSSKDGTMDRQTDLVGEGGVIKWNETGKTLTLFGKDRTVTETVADEKQFQDMYRDLIASIRAGKPSPTLPTLEDCVAALEAVIRAHEAAQ